MQDPSTCESFIDELIFNPSPYSGNNFTKDNKYPCGIFNACFIAADSGTRCRQYPRTQCPVLTGQCRMKVDECTYCNVHTSRQEQWKYVAERAVCFKEGNNGTL